MKKALLARLRCPRCRNELQAHAFRTQDFVVSATKNALVADSEDMPLGVLTCGDCMLWFPVLNHVPVMLLFNTSMTDGFKRRFAGDLQLFSEYHSPNFAPEPGERAVQRTFTEEWSAVEDSEFTFSYTADDNVALQRRVWLSSIDVGKEPIGSVLDVGCGGFAAEAVALRELNASVEVFAVDSNFALITNGHRIVAEERVHAVVASLFHMPFEKSSFDLVFSQGVIHHTWSTRTALTEVSGFCKTGGLLFVWVYAKEDPLISGGWRGFRDRLRYIALMRMLRPVVSRLPKPLRLVFIYPLAGYNHIRFRMTGTRKPGWRFANSVHGVYDMVSPQFAHDHGFNEVVEWFEDLGYSVALHSPKAYRELFNRPIHGIGLLGRKGRAVEEASPPVPELVRARGEASVLASGTGQPSA